jgi:hypothetical protein
MEDRSFNQAEKRPATMRGRGWALRKFYFLWKTLPRRDSTDNGMTMFLFLWLAVFWIDIQNLAIPQTLEAHGINVFVSKRIDILKDHQHADHSVLFHELAKVACADTRSRNCRNVVSHSWWERRLRIYVGGAVGGSKRLIAYPQIRPMREFESRSFTGIAKVDVPNHLASCKRFTILRSGGVAIVAVIKGRWSFSRAISCPFMKLL